MKYLHYNLFKIYHHQQSNHLVAAVSSQLCCTHLRPPRRIHCVWRPPTAWNRQYERLLTNDYIITQ